MILQDAPRSSPKGAIHSTGQPVPDGSSLRRSTSDRFRQEASAVATGDGAGRSFRGMRWLLALPRSCRPCPEPCRQASCAAGAFAGSEMPGCLPALGRSRFEADNLARARAPDELSPTAEAERQSRRRGCVESAGGKGAQRCLSRSSIKRAGLGLTRWVVLVGVCAASPRVSAFFGGGAVTIVADAPGERHFAAEMARWSSQLAEMARVVRNGQTLISQAEEAARVVGDPALALEWALGRSSARLVFAPGSEQALDAVARTFDASRVWQETGPVGAGNLGLGRSMPVLGGQQLRSEARYADLSLKAELRERWQEALDAARSVEIQEREEYERVKDLLAQARDQSEVTALQACLSASAQRLELARHSAWRIGQEHESVVQAASDAELLRKRAEEEQEREELKAFGDWVRRNEGIFR